jgi:hypothetical protein
MRRKALVLGVGLLVSGGLTMAAPASAGPVCAGTTSTAYFCSDPLGRPLWTDCVYVGPPPCIPVTVPGPTLSCGGEILDRAGIGCYW